MEIAFSLITTYARGYVYVILTVRLANGVKCCGAQTVCCKGFISVMREQRGSVLNVYDLFWPKKKKEERNLSSLTSWTDLCMINSLCKLMFLQLFTFFTCYRGSWDNRPLVMWQMATWHLSQDSDDTPSVAFGSALWDLTVSQLSCLSAYENVEATTQQRFQQTVKTETVSQLPNNEKV